MARTPNQPQSILRTDEATKRVRELAESSSNVIFTDHAREQGRARDISTEDVMRILRSGFINDAPIAEDGKWKVKVLFKLRGQRDAGVVALILWQGKLVIKTVEWEDWK